MSWQNRIAGHGEESPENLMAHPLNWRIHPDFQQRALEEALLEVGWVDTVTVNQRTGHVLDGHLRVTLAMREGAESVPVKYVDLAEEEERTVLATFDPIAGLAAQDEDKLEELIQAASPESDELRELMDSLLEVNWDAGDQVGNTEEANTEARAILKVRCREEDKETVKGHIEGLIQQLDLEDLEVE